MSKFVELFLKLRYQAQCHFYGAQSLWQNNGTKYGCGGFDVVGSAQSWEMGEQVRACTGVLTWKPSKLIIVIELSLFFPAPAPA